MKFTRMSDKAKRALACIHIPERKQWAYELYLGCTDTLTDLSMVFSPGPSIHLSLIPSDEGAWK